MTTAIHEKIAVHIYEKEYKKALETAKMLDRSHLSKGSYLTLGHLYYKLNQTDSAYFYLTKAIGEDTEYSIQYEIYNDIKAPINVGDKVGSIIIISEKLSECGSVGSALPWDGIGG